MVCFEQGIGGDDELTHNGGDGDFGGFAGGDELLVFGLEVWIEAGGDQSRHVEGLADVGPATANETLAFPLAGLAGDRGKAGRRGHGGNDRR